MYSSFLDKKPREISFYHKGSKVSPDEVFTILYNGLNPLINRNLETFMFNRNKERYRGMGHPTRVNDDSLQKKLTQEWKEGLPEERIIAEVVFDDSSERRYKINARSNFTPQDIIKFPNMALLIGEDDQVVLREARKYSSDLIKRLGSKRYGIRFDARATMQFEGENKSLVMPKRRVMNIPEPNLVLALEKLYFEGRIPRLTPPVAVVGSSRDKLWYLRDFLPTVLDTGIDDLSQLAAYLGTQRALGLMEGDRQLIHYVLWRDQIVNFDPDFMFLTRNSNLVRDMEISDFKEVMSEQNKKDSTTYLTAEEIDNFGRRSTQYMRELEEKGVNPSLLLNTLSPEIRLGDDIIRKIRIDLNPGGIEQKMGAFSLADRGDN
ncbi:hypothetical protein HYX17_01035 [Candidatus Woesearchaeota archaeon]|nr:hypothetical protein [Candidatus Woesearchaeota archaeon]